MLFLRGGSGNAAAQGGGEGEGAAPPPPPSPGRPGRAGRGTKKIQIRTRAPAATRSRRGVAGYYVVVQGVAAEEKRGPRGRAGRRPAPPPPPPPPGGRRGGARPNAPAAGLRGPGSLGLVHRAERGIREGLAEGALELLQPRAHALALLRGHSVVVQHAFQVVELVLHNARLPPPQAHLDGVPLQVLPHHLDREVALRGVGVGFGFGGGGGGGGSSAPERGGMRVNAPPRAASRCSPQDSPRSGARPRRRRAPIARPPAWISVYFVVSWHHRAGDPSRRRG